MGIPAELTFKTKPELGAELLADCLDAGMPISWCAGDAVYGRDRGLREACEQRVNLATPSGRDIGHHLHWSRWRRRHQARARYLQ